MSIAQNVRLLPTPCSQLSRANWMWVRELAAVWGPRFVIDLVTEQKILKFFLRQFIYEYINWDRSFLVRRSVLGAPLNIKCI